MQEYYRLVAPIKGKQYNAVTATYITWDNGLLQQRYFADPADRRYLGTFLEGVREGAIYWELFDREGTFVRLDYEYDKTICLELVEDSDGRASIYSETIAKIDSAIKRAEKCCFNECNNPLKYGGNNAHPLMDSGCCDDCNIKKVVPARLNLMNGK